MLAYSSRFKRLETAAANRSKGSGAVARVICPRQGLGCEADNLKCIGCVKQFLLLPRWMKRAQRTVVNVVCDANNLFILDGLCD